MGKPLRLCLHANVFYVSYLNNNLDKIFRFCVCIFQFLSCLLFAELLVFMGWCISSFLENAQSLSLQIFLLLILSSLSGTLIRCLFDNGFHRFLILCCFLKNSFINLIHNSFSL